MSKRKMKTKAQIKAYLAYQERELEIYSADAKEEYAEFGDVLDDRRPALVAEIKVLKWVLGETP